MKTLLALPRTTYHLAVTLAMILILALVTTPSPQVLASTPDRKAPTPTRQTIPTAKPVSARERAGRVTAVKHKFALSRSPGDLEIITARAFSEPLIPMSTKLVPGENQALAKALTAFRAKTDSGDVSDLTAFLQAYPTSRWRPSLELNLGLRRFETGYLTDALAYWASAWERSKNEKGQQQQPVAEGAISQLLLLNARLGHLSDLRKYMAELGTRGLHGSSAQRLDAAHQGLYGMEHSPQTAYKCGPFAVNTLLYLDQPTKAIDPRLKAAASTSQGTNLAQVNDWAAEVGLNYQMAKRSRGAALIVPAVMHWKIGHFAAVTAQKDGRYRIQDPTFGSGGNLWITPQAIDAESDGYFLVPAALLPPGWHTVTRTEAQGVWGKGLAENRDEAKTPSNPQQCPGANCNCNGMARASAWNMQAELNIMDVPLSYSPPIGPSMDFLVNYSQNEENQPGTFTFTNLGAWWTLNWVSWLTVDASRNATVHVRGGGDEIYPYSQPDNVSNPYPPNLTSQAVLAVSGAGVYQRQLPDGSIEVFSLSDGAGNIFMTQVIDPQGNPASISYDANFRITSITDANGNSTTVSYVSNTIGNSGFYLVSQLADPFGRTASFAYDSTNTYLVSITDAIGLVSQFAYTSGSSFITGMTTPYGTTFFSTYTPSGSAPFPPRGLRFIFPDNTIAVIENWLGETKSTYFWDREAMSLYPLDPGNQNYTHCKTSKWLLNASTNAEAPVVNWIKPALEAPVTYSYQGEQAQDFIGVSNRPTQIIRNLTGNLGAIATIGGTVTTGDILTITVLDAGLTGGQESVSYTVNSVDSLSSIAAGLAGALNADTHLQAIGVSATSLATAAHIQSASSNVTSYSQSTSNAATETIALTANLNAAVAATVGGTATLSDVLIITVHDVALPSGQDAVSYQVKSGDTLTTIASGLAAAINSDTTLQSIGVTGSSSGPVATIQSFSSNQTTYSSSLSSGATETLALESTVTSQTWSYHYNAFGHVTQAIDPIGRTFSYLYSANNVDLLEKREKKDGDNFLIGKWEYNTQHLPTLYIDGSGQRTQYAYNVFGDLISLTDALSHTTTLTYTSTATATIGGTVTTGNTLRITVLDPALSGGQEQVSYTVVGGDTLTTIATHLATNINNDAALQTLGVTATSAGAVMTIKSISMNATAYSQSVTGTETITLSKVVYGFLTLINGPLAGNSDITTFTWNNTGTLSSVTDSEGYTLTYTYDNFDRLTKTSYPDGTSDQIGYQDLDPVFFIDRLGRTTQDAYDSMDQLTVEIDPLGRKTQYAWCACGSLSSLTDPAGHTTTWNHDLEGRVTQKVYADTTSISYAYETTTSRLHTRTDALNQISTYSYNLDNTLSSIAYTNAVNPTSTVTLSYDQTFPRISTVQNGWGTYTYTFNPYITDPFATPTTGGGRLQSVSNSVIPNSTTTYSYDAIGRTGNRQINGNANSITWTYDAMSRITSEQNVLGTFNYTYVDQTPTDKGTLRLAQIGYPNGQTAKFSWYSTTYDERLQQITNLNPTSNALSQFNYAYDSAGEITRWLQQQAPSHPNYALGYDLAGQLSAAQAGTGTAPPPYCSQFYYNYDQAANRTAVQQSSIQSANIGGTKGTGDTIQITVKDPSLSGGQEVVPAYTVQAGDTLATIAAGLAATVTADANLQAVGINATATSTTVAFKSDTTNNTSYSAAITGTETVTFGINGSIENITIGGTKHTTDTLTITVYDLALSGGSKSDSYTVQASDTLTTIASALATAINNDGSLSAVGVTATSANTLIAVQSLSSNVTTYTTAVTGTGATETMTAGVSLNGIQSALIGGSKSTGDILTITVQDAGLAGAQETVSYTVASGDTLSTITSGLAAAINNDTNLQKIGVTATSSSTLLKVTSVSTNATSYLFGRSSGATETILWGLPPNGTQTAAIGGSKSTGDVLTITPYDAGLTGGSKAINYTVAPGDTLNTIASGLASAISADTSLQAIGVTAAAVTPTASVSVINLTSTSNSATTYTQSVGGTGGHTETIVLASSIGASQASCNNVNELTNLSAGAAVRFQATTDRPVQPVQINGSPVGMNWTQSFTGNPVLNPGSNSVTVSAIAGGGSGATTNTYQLSVTGPSSQSLIYDASGNMTSDGTNTYQWDAENRLIQITYPGPANKTQFDYDGLGRCVQIKDIVSGGPTSTKQFVWCGNQICEARDGSGSIVSQYFPYGQVTSGTSYFYTRDHLGSVREVTNSSSAVQAQYGYDPYGQVTFAQGSNLADLQYAGYYSHQRSGLNLTLRRFYSATLGRWLNRDPLGERGGINLFSYIANDPMNSRDPLGLLWLKGRISSNNFLPPSPTPSRGATGGQGPQPAKCKGAPPPDGGPGDQNPDSPGPAQGSPGGNDVPAWVPPISYGPTIARAPTIVRFPGPTKGQPPSRPDSPPSEEDPEKEWNDCLKECGPGKVGDFYWEECMRKCLSKGK